MSNTKNKDQQFYAYYDTIEETGEVIYCGKGNDFRTDLNKSPKRNKYYNNIVNKYKIIRTRIPTLDEDLALELENWLMEYYHTWIDDPLATKHACNIDGPGTNGGSKKRSKESNIKNGNSHRGKKQSRESVEKRNAKNRGLKRSPETIEKLRQKKLGTKQTQERINNRIQKVRGQKRTKEFCDSMGILHSKPVNKIDIHTNEIVTTFKSMKEATKILHIPQEYIRACCRGLMETAGGYKWEFVQKFPVKREIIS